MGEYYTAEDYETPVTIDYPWAYDGKPAIHQDREYYGTQLSIAEIVEKLAALGFIDRSDDPDNNIPSIDYATGQPLHSNRHEFIVSENTEWGWDSGWMDNAKRISVQISLYFNEWDYNDNRGYAYIYEVERLLSLIDY